MATSRIGSTIQHRRRTARVPVATATVVVVDRAMSPAARAAASDRDGGPIAANGQRPHEAAGRQMEAQRAKPQRPRANRRTVRAAQRSDGFWRGCRSAASVRTFLISWRRRGVNLRYGQYPASRFRRRCAFGPCQRARTEFRSFSCANRCNNCSPEAADQLGRMGT